MKSIREVTTAKQLKHFVERNMPRYPFMVTAHGDGTVSMVYMTHLSELVPQSLRAGNDMREAINYLKLEWPSVSGCRRVSVKQALTLLRRGDNKKVTVK